MLAEKDFAAFTAEEIAERHDGCVAASCGTLVNAGHGDGFAAAARGSMSGAQSPTAFAPAAMSSSCCGGRGACVARATRAALRHQRIDGALLAHAAAFRPRRHRAPSSSRSVSLLHSADPNHEELRVPGRTRRWPRCRGRYPTGPEGRGSAAPSKSSISGGAAASSTAGRWCC